MLQSVILNRGDIRYRAMAKCPHCHAVVSSHTYAKSPDLRIELERFQTMNQGGYYCMKCKSIFKKPTAFQIHTSTGWRDGEQVTLQNFPQETDEQSP